MAIGDTVQAGLMRIDTSAYERAGQANANANMAFGNALNQVAKGFIEGREKKARANEIKEELMRQGVPEDAAGNISKNPFLQKERARQEAAKQQMQIEGNRIAVQREGIRSQARSASDSNALKSRSMDMAQEGADELKQSATNIAKFNFTPPEIPITKETPAAFLPELDPDPFVGPPTTYQGQAPAVAQLPESFQPQGAQVVDAVQSGRLSPLEGNRIIGDIRGQAMAEQKAGPTRSEDLNERKFQRQIVNEDRENQPMPPVDAVYKESALAAIDTAIDKSKLFFATGVTGQVLSNFASTDAKDLSAAISTVEAAVGFDRLQDMRDASKTGGALGAINTKELQLLSASLGSLDPLQKPETLRANLDSIRERYVKIIKSIEAEKYAYKQGITFETPKQAMEFVEQFNASPQSQNPNTIDPADLENAIQAKKKQLEQRTMMQQTLNNPNVPNYGPQ
tara:strand:- start:2021 stop:3382 length:1362 start_codon:yes stop_codon:yes gene_type:complete